MHPVGDRADRHLLGVELRPQAAEHRPADPAVQLGHAVGALGQAQPHVRHVEHARVVLGAQRQHPLGVHAGQQHVLAEVVAHQVDREPVDAGRHRGVRGEHGAGAHRGQRLVEVQALAVDQLADALQAEEPGVALVGVEHLGPGVAGQLAERAHRPHPADAGQDLLADAVVLVAAVEPVGDPAQVLVVVLHVGVQQQQRDPADLGPPDPGAQHPAAGHGHVHQDRRARGLGEQFQRQAPGVEHRVVLDLPAVQRQRLAEVAGAVEQADADQRHAQVGGGLEVVAGEHAKATRVVGQRLGDAELHGEVGDRVRQQRVVPAGGPALVGLLLAALVPARRGQVVVQVLGDGSGAGQEVLVTGQRLQPADRHLGEQPERVVAHPFPGLRVHRGEQLLGGRVPGPAQVGGERAQRGQWLGQAGADSEPAECSHPSDLIPHRPVPAELPAQSAKPCSGAALSQWSW